MRLLVGVCADMNQHFVPVTPMFPFSNSGDYFEPNQAFFDLVLALKKRNICMWRAGL